MVLSGCTAKTTKLQKLKISCDCRVVFIFVLEGLGLDFSTFVQSSG